MVGCIAAEVGLDQWLVWAVLVHQHQGRIPDFRCRANAVVTEQDSGHCANCMLPKPARPTQRSGSRQAAVQRSSRIFLPRLAYSVDALSVQMCPEVGRTVNVRGQRSHPAPSNFEAPLQQSSSLYSCIRHVVYSERGTFSGDPGIERGTTKTIRTRGAMGEGRLSLAHAGR